MKNLKKRWENELKSAVPPLCDSVKNAEIPVKDSMKRTPSSKVVSERRKVWQKPGLWAGVCGGVACAFAMAVVLPGLWGGSGEVKASEMKVMNISCNPSVEFVLNEEDVVVSVNALNEEGNLVISAETFDGKTAEEAARLFVQVAEESGFIVSGSNVELIGVTNEITVAFSGDSAAAEALYDTIKGEVENYFTKKDIQGRIAKAEKAITEEDLKILITECSPNIALEKVQAMGYAELVEMLADARQETKDLYSQELKNAYYEMKAFALEKSGLDTVKENVDVITATILDGVYTPYTEAVSAIEEMRIALLVDEDSPYQQALEAFRLAKTQYLNYRNEVAQMEKSAITDAVLAQLNGYKNVLEEAESVLRACGIQANEKLEEQKEFIKGIYEEVLQTLNGFELDVKDYADKIESEHKQASEKAFEDFKTKCEKEINAAHDKWTEMKGELGKGKHGFDEEPSREEKPEQEEVDEESSNHKDAPMEPSSEDFEGNVEEGKPSVGEEESGALGQEKYEHGENHP
ncbi:MAG: hypothetical protein IJV83_01920 [Clostridia bacterium]|nr:hypothetical protein [Clostridia bacterium]